MAGDLERFLQQAAERLKQKLEQAKQPPPAPRQPAPVRQAERARPVVHVEPELVPATVVPQGREAGPNPLSNLDTRPGLAQQISLADERMAEHVNELFDHPVSSIQKASSHLNDASSPIIQSDGVTIRSKQSSPFVQMLRKPETLRAAFLASEIFSRRF